MDASVTVTCSSEVQISAPDALSDSSYFYAFDSGEQVFTLNAFETDDINCPILKYILDSKSTAIF